MLRPRTRQVLKPSHHIYRRHSSNAAPKYSGQVRAVPFALSKDEAILRLCLPMSFKCWGRGIMGSIGATYLPGLGFKPLQPTRIQAVYIPTWFVEAEAEAEARVQEPGINSKPEWNSDARATFTLQSSYMPGFFHEPLSRLSLKPGFYDVDTVPITQEFRDQHADVLHLPYTVAPFHLFDVARSSPTRSLRLSGRMDVDPTTVKENMLVAYPVLIPIYLAQYELPNMGDALCAMPMTVVLEAFEKEGRVIAEDIDKEVVRKTLAKDPTTPRFMRKLSDLLSPEEFWVPWGDADLRQFTKVNICAPSPFLNCLPYPRAEDVTLQRLINNIAARKGALQEYQSQYYPIQDGQTDPPIDWTDPRIRQFTAEEKERNRTWLSLSHRRHFFGNVVTLAGKFDSQSETAQPDPNKVDIGIDDRVFGIQYQTGSKDLGELVAELEQKREETKPDWLKVWESRKQTAGGSQ